MAFNSAVTLRKPSEVGPLVLIFEQIKYIYPVDCIRSCHMFSKILWAHISSSLVHF